MTKKTEKLKKAFKASCKSEEIELDNLDKAWLAFSNENDEDIVVENEHGTQFPIDYLSDQEIKAFIYDLEGIDNWFDEDEED